MSVGTSNPVGNFFLQSDTFTNTGNGSTIDVTANPISNFSVQVVGTGTAATLWDVRIEGSIDNVNFTQILQHTNAIGNAVLIFSGAAASPSLYIRSRCAGLTLGSATNIVVTYLGKQ